MLAAVPPPKDHVRKLISLPPELWGRVQDYQFRMRHPSEVAALREMIERALDAADREEQRPGKKS